jgi:Ni/Fe-hydrogenase subunit HybB-like protein
MLVSLSGVMIHVLGLFLALRFADVLIAGKLAMLFNQGWLSLLFWVEAALFAAPIFMLAGSGRRRFKTMLGASILMMLAGSLYRFDTYIVAYNPGPNWNYFPTVPELLITFGAIALEIAIYVWIVKRFPILSGAPAASSAS